MPAPASAKDTADCPVSGGSSARAISLAGQREADGKDKCDRSVTEIAVEIAEGEPVREQNYQRDTDTPCGPRSPRAAGCRPRSCWRSTIRPAAKTAPSAVPVRTSSWPDGSSGKPSIVHRLAEQVEAHVSGKGVADEDHCRGCTGGVQQCDCRNACEGHGQHRDDEGRGVRGCCRARRSQDRRAA